jgi:hypothetical protein
VKVYVEAERLSYEEMDLILDKRVGDRITVVVNEDNIVIKVIE